MGDASGPRGSRGPPFAQIRKRPANPRGTLVGLAERGLDMLAMLDARSPLKDLRLCANLALQEARAGVLLPQDLMKSPGCCHSMVVRQWG